ncbi:hypothetical protein PUP68_15075 [Pseudomonas chlororaphis]|uniref:HIT family protein n=2 Tax=Pseudomonas chlororaphis TaxID=587753 RepID=UPI0006A5C286|nr:hypothetical protein [Pseudomonas chlororaphis]AZC30747.1 Diadenosine tetraphosphate (Ap4A) hydrolase [Pseudomonas chlororaphis subsp. piscium]WDG88382.1 hypothetical protein PUP68_15075 [Pseudomonas chlororaphis]SDT10150.1 Diadenosine tetraphosphate (Ap4A) hydrolase [Pseudomonas chlororaphis]
MDSMSLLETEHWRISYRRDARHPGSLIVASRAQASDLVDLTPPALTTLGQVLALSERLLRLEYQPHKVVFYKLGFSSGFSVHFHVVAVTRELLQEIVEHPDYPDEPDGNDAILFVSREYAERALTATEQLEQTQQVERLRQRLASLD